MFGIDFTSSGSYRIRYLEDVGRLLSHKDVKVHQTYGAVSVIKDVKGNELPFTTIVIEDNKVVKMTIGSKLEKGFKKEYIILDLSIRDKGEHNLVPLSKEQYDRRLEDVIEHIHNEYGLLLTSVDASFRMIEINNTVKMDKKIREYYRILKLIAEFAPSRYVDNNLRRDGKKRLKGIYVGNNSVEYKLYNKTKQLEEVYKIIVDGEYLRFEIVLLNAKKIKEVFKTTKINEISIEMLAEYYKDIVYRDLFKKFDKYIKDSNKELNKIAEKEKEKDIKKWVKSFFLAPLSLKYDVSTGKIKEEVEDEELADGTDIDLVFDIQQILDIIKKHAGKNYSRAYKNLIEYIEQRPHIKENLDKYAEIKEKILNIEY